MINFIEKAKAAFDANFLAEEAGKQQAGNINSVAAIITKVVDAMLLIAGILAIIYFLYSGILYITAAGNPDNVKKGQTGLIYGAIGIAVCVLAFFLARSIATYAGTNLGNVTPPAK